MKETNQNVPFGAAQMVHPLQEASVSKSAAHGGQRQPRAGSICKRHI